MVPSALNKGKMSGVEAAQWFRNEETARIAVSRLLASIIQSVPEAANNPNVVKDMQLFAQNIANELEKAGVQAVSDPMFYQSIETAFQKTLTMGIDEATIKGLENSKLITTVSTASRGGRSNRVVVSKTAQQELNNGTYVQSYKSRKSKNSKNS